MDEALAKVHFDLPNHWAMGGESMWALDLGGDLYELRSVPFYAYGVNCFDEARVPGSFDGKPPESHDEAI